MGFYSSICTALLVTQTLSTVTAGHNGYAFSAPDIVPDVYMPEEVCVPILSKCGGLSYTGGTSCCDSSTSCVMKDDSYSQCRSDCPSGWACELSTSEMDPQTTVTLSEETTEVDISTSGSCVASLEKCGGLSWTGVSECCESGQTCFSKESSYSQCRSDCPTGWLCDEKISLEETVMETDVADPAPDLESIPTSTTSDAAEQSDDSTNDSTQVPVWDSSQSNVKSMTTVKETKQVKSSDDSAGAPTVADTTKSDDIMGSDESEDASTVADVTIVDDAMDFNEASNDVLDATDDSDDFSVTHKKVVSHVTVSEDSGEAETVVADMIESDDIMDSDKVTDSAQAVTVVADVTESDDVTGSDDSNGYSLVSVRKGSHKHNTQTTGDVATASDDTPLSSLGLEAPKDDDQAEHSDLGSAESIKNDYTDDISNTDDSVSTDYVDNPPNTLNPESTSSATKDRQSSLKDLTDTDVYCISEQGQCGGAHWHGGTTCCDSESYSCFVKDSTFSQCMMECPSGWSCAVESIEPLKTSSVEETVEEVSSVEEVAASANKPSPAPSFKPTTPAPSTRPIPTPTKIPTHKPTMKPTQKPYPKPTYFPSPKPTTELFKQIRKYELKYDQYFIAFMGAAFVVGFVYSFFQARALGQGKAWWKGTVAYPKPGNEYGKAFALESGLLLRNKLGVIEMCGSCVPWKNGSLPHNVVVTGPTPPSEGTPLRPERGPPGGKGDMLSGIGNVKLRKTQTKEPKPVNNTFADVEVKDEPKTEKKKSVTDEEHREMAQSILDNQGVEHIVQMMKETNMLKHQLKTLGAAPVEVVELDEAEKRMRDAVRRLIEGDMNAETEIERWDNCIRMNPDYIKREEDKAQEWERSHRDRNRAALRHMRCLVPPDVYQCSIDDMISKGLPPATAKRIRENKAIWLIRYSAEHIKKLHIAELSSKYSHQGLDLVEMRAIYSMLPSEFDNDNDGKKADWYSMFRQRLQDLCLREDNNSLAKADKRHRAYKDADTLRLFDPDAIAITASVQKSTAFKPTVKPKLSRSRSVYVSRSRDPSAGGPRGSKASAKPEGSSSIPPRPQMAGLLAAVQQGTVLKKKKKPQKRWTSPPN